WGQPRVSCALPSGGARPRSATIGTPFAVPTFTSVAARSWSPARQGTISTDSLDPDRDMIAFACPPCGASLPVDEGRAGRAGPCPACSRAVRVPAAGGSPPSDSSAAAVRASGQATLPPRAAAEDTAPVLPDSPQLAPSPDYPFLASPQEPDELGRL